MKLETLGDIDLISKAWYLVRINGIHPSGYVIAQAVSRIKDMSKLPVKCIVVLEYNYTALNNNAIIGLIKLSNK